MKWVRWGFGLLIIIICLVAAAMLMVGMNFEYFNCHSFSWFCSEDRLEQTAYSLMLSIGGYIVFGSTSVVFALWGFVELGYFCYHKITQK